MAGTASSVIGCEHSGGEYPGVSGDWQQEHEEESSEHEEESSDFVPLTAEQAQALRLRQPMLSPWWVVLGQVVVGLVVVGVAWWVSGRQVVAVSAAWGVLAVVLPAALFALGIIAFQPVEPCLGHGAEIVAFEQKFLIVEVAINHEDDAGFDIGFI